MRTRIQIFIPILCLQFLFSGNLSAEKNKLTVNKVEYDTELDVKPEHPGEKGSFVLNKNDIAECRGPEFQGEPKDSKPVSFKGKKYQSLAFLNNEGAEMLEKEGGISKAKEIFSFIVKKDPLFFPAVYNLARVLQIKGEYDESLYEFGRAEKLLPDYYRTYYHQGLIWKRKKKDQKSLPFFRAASKLQPFREEADYMLCETSVYSGTQDFQKFIFKNKPRDRTVNQNLCEAVIHYKNEDYAKAVKVLKKVKIPKDADIFSYSRKFHFIYAESAYKIGDNSTAFEQWTKLLETPFDPIFMDIQIITLKKKIQKVKKQD